MKQADFVPFDPVNKRTVATVVDAAGKTRHYAKGAPQAITALAKPDPPGLPLSGRRRRARRHGYRALGVGSRMTARPGALSGSSR